MVGVIGSNKCIHEAIFFWSFHKHNNYQDVKYTGYITDMAGEMILISNMT